MTFLSSNVFLLFVVLQTICFSMTVYNICIFNSTTIVTYTKPGKIDFLVEKKNKKGKAFFHLLIVGSVYHYRQCIPL